MKLIIKTLLLSFVLLNFACTQDAPTADDPSAEATTTVVEEELEEEDTSTISAAIVEPPRDAEEIKIVDEQIKNSPFYNLGCCEEEDKQKRTCCCKAVVDKYKEIRAEGNTDLILKVKTEDPIFSGCKRRKKWRLAIDEIENPPASSDSEEEEFDF